MGPMMMISLMCSSLRAAGVVGVTWVGVVSDVLSPSVLGGTSSVVGGSVVGGGLKRAGRKWLNEDINPLPTLAVYMGQKVISEVS